MSPSIRTARTAPTSYASRMARMAHASRMARVTRAATVAAILSLVLAACGGTGGTDGTDGTGAADLPSTDDLVAGDREQSADPVEDEPPATSSMCTAEEPDCQDTIAPGEESGGKDEGHKDSEGSGAADSCLAGDPDCTDESHEDQDVARPIPLSGSPSGAQRIEPGPTSGAGGSEIVAVHLVDDATLEVTFFGGACDRLEDVVVTESPGEVRLLVLSGMDTTVEVCTMQLVQWSTEVALDQPLGDRTVLDLAG